MNEADIKKCIKNGYAWSSCGEKPEKTSTRDYMRGHLKTFDGLHATKCEAQAAIDARKADSDHDHLFRTWKGPLTEGARKNLRPDDRVWVAYSYDEAHSTTHGILLQPESAWLMGGNRLFLHEDEAKAAAHDLWLADRRANQMKAIDDEQDKQLLPDDETWTFCVNGPVKADCRITRVGCFFAEKAARVAWLAEMRSHQMEPISKEQGERIDPQELVWYAGNGVVEEDRLIVVFPSLEKGQLYFSARAAQAALDRAKGVESHETPVGETQPKEAATDETQDKAMKPVEHKLPDIPSWAPPLPEGYVPLGFGGTFKVERPFGGGCSTKVSPKWDAWHMDIGWCGDKTSGFYIAPRDSEIVRLNFPWLAEEAKKANAKPNHEPISVLDEAKACVCGPRRRDYGTPDENFGRIADLWNVHLKDKLAKPMTPGDVAMMMILLKVARQANSPKRDNLVDIAGYAQCASELKEEK